MQNRRLIVLFVAFLLGFCILAARLLHLQVAEAEAKREIIRNFVHRTHVIETYRGAIVDRKGQVLAQDVPSDDLAIDYRAMNYDDTWLMRAAVDRLKAAGEWGNFPDRETRNRRIAEMKAELAGRIDAIPDAIAQVCKIPREEVLDRFQEIRARIHALRQDAWLRKFDREAKDRAGGGGAGGNGALDDASLDAAYRETRVREEQNAHTVRENIPPAVANYFRQNIDQFPGLMVRDIAHRRDYPYGAATAHIIGTMRGVDADAVKTHPFELPNLLDTGATTQTAASAEGGYLPGDRMGETGVEKLAEGLLRGARGARLVDLTDDGREAEADTTRVEPAPGQVVRLTIDAAYQRDLYAALLDPAKKLLRGDDEKDGHFVGIVVLSLDGQVLALVSYPSYDPNAIDDLRGVLNSDEWRHPLYSRAFRTVYRPGSTIKPLLATAALMEGVITPQESITCTGHYFPTRPDIFKCDAVHGATELVKAIEESCNVYFYTVGERMGVPRLVQWYGNYGLGHETGMELPESQGLLPKGDMTDPDGAKSEALFLGIGQGKLDVTPLQMANAYATLLRGGLAIAPRILADTPMQQKQVFTLSPEVLGPVEQGMERVVTSGTARSVFRGFNMRVAGKTGTAETLRAVFDGNGNLVEDPARPVKNPDGTPKLKADGTPMYAQRMEMTTDAWFVGYVPIDRPRFVVAAVMESGGHGGRAAAPMVKEAFSLLMKHGYLRVEEGQ